MKPLTEVLSKSTKLSMLRNAVWVLSNLCRGKNPPPSFEQVQPCLPVLGRLLFHNDSDILTGIKLKIIFLLYFYLTHYYS